MVFMEIKKIRNNLNLTQKEFAKNFQIPLRTLQGWEQGLRNPPTYVIFMIQKIIDLEKEKLL